MGSMRLDRVPPNNSDAERSVLGACLLPGDSALTIAKVVDILKPNMFYKEAHEIIYKAILNLFERNEPADQITVTKELMRLGELEKVGDYPYIDEVIDSTPTSANVEYYAKIVLDEYRKRHAIRKSVELYNNCYDDSMEATQILDEFESAIAELRNTNSKGFINVKDLLRPVIDGILGNEEDPSAVLTGFKDVDRYLISMVGGDYVIVAARPGMGKTSFAMNIALSVAEKGDPVGIFSLEMTAHSLARRMFSSIAHIPHDNIRRRDLSDDQKAKLTYAASHIYESRLYIDETSGINEKELRARAMRLVHQNKVKLIIIDYMQLMACAVRKENRQQEMTEISRAIKNIARDFNIPVIALSQLSRASESRSDKRPQLSDLRESGAIEQDADVVLFLYHDKEMKGTSEVIIAKQRNGWTGTVELSYQPQYLKFADLDKQFKGDSNAS